MNEVLSASEELWGRVEVEGLRLPGLESSVVSLVERLAESGRGAPPPDAEKGGRRADLENHMRYWIAIWRFLAKRPFDEPELAEYVEPRALRPSAELLSMALTSGISDAVVANLEWIDEGKSSHSKFIAERCRFAGGQLADVDVDFLGLYASSLLGLSTSHLAAKEIDLRSALLYEASLDFDPNRLVERFNLSDSVIQYVTITNAHVREFQFESALVISERTDADSSQLVAARDSLREVIDETNAHIGLMPAHSDAASRGPAVRFVKCHFERASFNSSSLRGALFDNCTFGTATFAGANLDGAVFVELTEASVDWTGAEGNYSRS